MCSLLGRQGADAFQLAWTDVIFATSDQENPENDTSYLNEAFADFLASQVVGGTNYFGPTSDFFSSESMDYCDAGSLCLEENFSAAATYRNGVARAATLLHDAFDGPNSQPNDGSHWRELGGAAVYVGGEDSNRADEDVELPASDLRRLFGYWDARGTLLNEDNFLGGLADLARARGYREIEVCRLFALHEPSGRCPAYVSDTPWLAWVAVPSSPAFEVGFAQTPVPVNPAAALPGAWQALMAEGASSGTGSSSGTPPQPSEETPDAEPWPLVVVEGVQKTRARGLGKEERDTAFAFRVGEGWWDGIDPLGRGIAGGFDARRGGGRELRLHLAPEFDAAVAELVVASLEPLDTSGADVEVDGPAKITLRLKREGRVVGKIRVSFTATLDGQSVPGTYTAKLSGRLAR
jgi:hypothetical protein